MEERSSARLVTQRQLEVEPRPPDAGSPPVLPAPPPPPSPPPSLPRVPSNRDLLERQIRWLRERAKFESKRPEDEGTK
jgi:hypothetical protein